LGAGGSPSLSLLDAAVGAPEGAAAPFIPVPPPEASKSRWSRKRGFMCGSRICLILMDNFG